MPKKKNPESQKEQSERFKKTVAELVAAGELNPIEADKEFTRLLDQQALRRRLPS